MEYREITRPSLGNDCRKNFRIVIKSGVIEEIASQDEFYNDKVKKILLLDMKQKCVIKNYRSDTFCLKWVFWLRDQVK